MFYIVYTHRKYIVYVITKLETHQLIQEINNYTKTLTIITLTIRY